MKIISITATEEGTGKTAIALALGLIAQDRDLDTGYIKPKGTRLQSHVGKILDKDPLLAAELLGLEEDLKDLEPVIYSPIFVENAVRGQEDARELRERIRRSFEHLSSDRDVMLIEGAGDLDIGGIVDLTDSHIARELDAEVVLIANFARLGDLDGLLAALGTIGNRLTGVVFNDVRDAASDTLEQDAIPFLEQRGYPVLGVLPHERELAGVTVDALAGEIGAEQLTTVPSDGFTERFIVGAMSGDAAFRHFRRCRHAAVITGGDRPEIHAAAIDAPGIECLVLTGGQRPPQTIIGKAEQAGLPVLLVTADTYATVERAEEVVRSGRARDAETVARMRELLQSHVEIDRILEAR